MTGRREEEPIGRISTTLTISNNFTAAAHVLPSPSSSSSPFFILLQQLALTTPWLFIGGILVYCVNYAVVTRNYRWQNVFTVLALGVFVASHFVAQVDCPPFASFRNCPIAIGVLKVLDMYMRKSSPLRYKNAKKDDNDSINAQHAPDAIPVASVDMDISPSPSPPPMPPPPPPSPAIQALLLLTEMRYESFQPNPIRVIKHYPFTEPVQFVLHTLVFSVLQQLPQHSTILAVEVLLAVYIIFTGLQIVLRYRNSPPMFAPLYTADSLAGFWSETWHNVFTSPCTALAYDPIRALLQKLGVPRQVARSCGVLAAFNLMAVFHVYCVYPILPTKGTMRVGIFFLMNGIATVIEVGLWGKRRNWIRKALAWMFEILLATWVAEATRLPPGLTSIQWAEICGARMEMSLVSPF